MQNFRGHRPRGLKFAWHDQIVGLLSPLLITVGHMTFSALLSRHAAGTNSTENVVSEKLRSQVKKIGTLKRTWVYCDLQAKRDECGYVICTRYS